MSLLAHPVAHRPEAASVGMRLLVRARRARLDRLIADGRSVAASRLLALRADQLTTPATRARLAAGIDDVLASLDLPASAVRGRAAAPADRRAVAACRSELRALADALLDAEHPRPRGIAIAHLLLHDGTGPLYAADGAEALRHTVRTALAAL